MRRWNIGILPAVLLFAAFGPASAQTRTAPSIGDVVRPSSGRVEARPGVSVRGVPLPGQQRCDNVNGYGYDGRYDRDDRFDRDRFDRNRDGRLDAKERKELEKARDKARKQAAKYDRKDGRDDRDDRYDRDDHRDDRFGCCTTGRYDTGSRDPRVSGSRNTGTGTIDARRSTNGAGIYNGGIYNSSGRVSQSNSRSNGCGEYNGYGQNQHDRR